MFLSPLIIILLILGYLDTGSPIFCQTRMGKNKKPFKLLKFRSMYLNTKSIATHLNNPSSVTYYGKFLRKSKLDEIPQLYNVFVGEMSLVGPRPNLLNQLDLIKEREFRDVYSVKPGITGLAQVLKIDMSNPKLLAKIDSKMISNLSFLAYIKLIFLTVSGKGFGDRI